METNGRVHADARESLAGGQPQTEFRSAEIQTVVHGAGNSGRRAAGLRGADGVIVYGRLMGQAEWTKLGVDTVSPFLDARPLAKPGVPEVREYYMYGMVNDTAIGQPSGIISVAWDGQ